MQFPYNIITSPQNYLDIDNISNIALELVAEENHYYFYAKTSAGKTQIVTYGPVEEDGFIPDKAKYTYTKIDYNTKKIASAITKFLEIAPGITIQVNIVSYKYIIKHLVDFIDYVGDVENEWRKDNWFLW